MKNKRNHTTHNPSQPHNKNSSNTWHKLIAYCFINNVHLTKFNKNRNKLHRPYGIPEVMVIFLYIWYLSYIVKGCRMCRSDKVSLWYVALLINTKFRFFILEQTIVKRI